MSVDLTNETSFRAAKMAIGKLKPNSKHKSGHRCVSQMYDDESFVMDTEE